MVQTMSDPCLARTKSIALFVVQSRVALPNHLGQSNEVFLSITRLGLPNMLNALACL